MINAGWEAVPTARSVPAKLASSMLCMVWSLRLVLTAIMTSAFRRMTRGHVNKFMMMGSTVKMKFTTAYSSPSILELENRSFEEQLVAFISTLSSEWNEEACVEQK